MMRRVLVVCAMAWLSALVVAPVAPAQEARFEGRTLTEWTAALADPQTRVRRQAVAALMTFGPAALPGLTQALADADPEVRLAGAKGLGRLGAAARPAVPALVEAMKDRVGIVRRVAALSLGSIRPSTPEAIAALVRALGDPDAAVLDNAAHSLLDLGQAAVPALTEALKHPDGGVRAGAAVALTAGVQFGQFRPVSAETVRALIEALKDSQPDVRDEVARVLAEVGPTGRVALGPLREVAQRDPVESVRRTAERAIERLESQNP
ncbi:MAG TPA: HEAT repeat domain-containing protein [Candidatus Limnocylindrales bacterium]|nr:HEAT repeat domain-containing protein [Candidatus Limnocylindrales bacterium]